MLLSLEMQGEPNIMFSSLLILASYHINSPLYSWEQAFVVSKVKTVRCGSFNLRGAEL